MCRAKNHINRRNNGAKYVYAHGRMAYVLIWLAVSFVWWPVKNAGQRQFIGNMIYSSDDVASAFRFIDDQRCA